MMLFVKCFKIGNPAIYLRELICECDQIRAFLLSKGQFLKPGKYKVLSLGKTIVYKENFVTNYFLKK